MSSRLEARLGQLEIRTNIGLGALAVAALSEAIRVLGLDASWLSAAEMTDRILTGLWISGLLVFGLTFTSVWLLGRRLDSAERRALGDELQLFVSRRSAVASYVVTYVAIVLVAAIPATVDLPGRAVAVGLMAVATGALLISRLALRP
jgi:hypothetical protein